MDKKQKPAKTPEAIAADQAALEAARKDVLALCSRVPGSVLAGSVQTAIAWKAQAASAYRLATSKQPKLADLQNARYSLQVAAAVH